MLLELTIYPTYLGIKFFNSSSQDIRLWESENSWGWDSISFQLKCVSGENIPVIRRKSRDWTENAPDFFVLPPEESHEMRLNINDGWWEVSENFLEWKDRQILVRARYEVGPTPEADKYNVSIGTILSDWVVSKPPHSWLRI